MSYSAHLLALHSFPTRRSSDLIAPFLKLADSFASGPRTLSTMSAALAASAADLAIFAPAAANSASGMDEPRSEEHTSELQSRFDIVCRLLLEKKKKTHLANTDF